MPITTARRKDRQLTEQEALDLIATADFGHLATIGEDGYPYVIPVNHALLDRTILIHCATVGVKLHNIRREPKVCFEVSRMIEIIPAEVPCAYGAKYESAIAFGKARVVEDVSQKRHALGVISKKYSGQDGPFEDKEIERVVVIAIDIESATCKARR